jgi:hypothetical protein
MDTFKTAYRSWAKFKQDENTIKTREKRVKEIPEANHLRIQPSLDDMISELMIDDDHGCEPVHDGTKNPVGEVSRCVGGSSA